MKEFKIENGVLVKYNGNKSRVVIPDGVTEIGIKAFFRCSDITSIEIPNSVKSIDFGAFCCHENLSSIKIPNSVTSIGDLAFYGCNNLTSVTIPSSVTSIGDHAFAFRRKVKPQYNANGTLRAFKAFNKNWTCRDFQYEIGKKYQKSGEIICCCVNGFHACPNPLDVFNYYYGELNNLRFAEVELSGKMVNEDEKFAASDIRIVRELTATDLAKIYNSMEKA